MLMAEEDLEELPEGNITSRTLGFDVVTEGEFRET